LRRYEPGGRDTLNSISLEEFLMMFNKAELKSVVSVVHARRIFGKGLHSSTFQLNLSCF